MRLFNKQLYHYVTYWLSYSIIFSGIMPSFTFAAKPSPLLVSLGMQVLSSTMKKQPTRAPRQPLTPPGGFIPNPPATTSVSLPSNIAISGAITTGGDVTVGGTLNVNQNGIKLFEDPLNGTSNVTFKAAEAMASDYTLRFPAANSSGAQYLANDGSGNLYWTTGSSAGSIEDGGNSFGHTIVIGSNDDFALSFETDGINRMTLSKTGALTVYPFAGDSERYVTTSSTGLLDSNIPVGIKNLLVVIKDHPVVEGKYYPTVQGALDWANAHATEPTAIQIEAGNYPIYSTLEVTNPFVRAIQGVSTGGTILVAQPSLVGYPVIKLAQWMAPASFGLQNISIDGTAALGFSDTLGSIGVLIIGTANFGIINVLLHGCHQGIVVDAEGTPPLSQVVVISDSYVLLSGDCGLLVDNGGFVSCSDVVIAWAVNDGVRVQNTDALSPDSELTLVSCWLTDDPATSNDGVLAKDRAYVLIESSRVYDQKNAIVVQDTARVRSLGNLRIRGENTHYQQVDGTARLQVVGDLVVGADPSKFLVADPANVYFDIFDIEQNKRSFGHFINQDMPIFNILTGNGPEDPLYAYRKNWFWLRGELFEMPEAAAGGLACGRAISVINNNSALVALTRGALAHNYTATLTLATYADAGDPSFPDYTKARSWDVYKQPGDHALIIRRWNGATWLAPFMLTMEGKLGLNSAGISAAPVAQFELGSGQIATPLGNAPAPSYSFTGDLNTGLFSPGADTIALSTQGLARLSINGAGAVTLSGLASGAQGVVKADTEGLLSKSLVVNDDIADRGGAYQGITDAKLDTISSPGKVANAATTATPGNGNDPVTIVARDSSGNFTATMITANLTGTVTGDITGNAAGFTGVLDGDVSGHQLTTQVDFVGGQTASAVSTATVAANSATALSSANMIVKRDAAKGFSAGTISADLFSGPLTGNVTGNVSGTSSGFTGALSGEVTGGQSSTTVASIQGVSATNIANGATAANNATSTNVSGMLVKRDGAGNFAATTITANLTGTASGNVALTGGTMSGPLVMNNVPVTFQNGVGNSASLRAPSAAFTNYTLSLPLSVGTNSYVLTSDGTGGTSWQPTGTAAGYFINGGNNFGGVGPAVVGTTAASGYGMNVIANGNTALALDAGGGVTVASLAGSGDRVVQANSMGLLSAVLPTGIKNVVQVISGVPTVVGKFYSSVEDAVSWANSFATEPTAVVIAAGNHTVNSTIRVTNTQLKAIVGEASGATRLVPGGALLGAPVLSLEQDAGPDVFVVQDLVIDCTGVPAFMTTPGSQGVYISGDSYYGLINVVIQGCYQGLSVDGLTASIIETVALTNCYIFLSGDCGLLVDNGGYVSGNNVTISFSQNQDIRAQRTNVGGQETQVSLNASWLAGDPLAGTSDGVLAKDTARVLISGSRVYYVQNAFVAEDSSHIKTAGNPLVSGIVTHYKQVDGTARLQAVGDLVDNVDPSHIVVNNPENVYFDVIDANTNINHIGRMVDTTYVLSSILTGNGVDDPAIKFVKNWFGYTGQGIELSEAALGGLIGVQMVATHNSDAYTASFIRGEHAHEHEAGLTLATYDSDGDPAVPDWSLADSWRLLKRANDHAFVMRRWNGTNYLAPFVVTADGYLGIDATGTLTTPTSQLQLGSGQIATPAGNAVAPSYSFTGDLNTGMYQAGGDTLALSAGGIARLTLDGTGAVTFSGLASLANGVVKANTAGLLSKSLISNSDVAADAAIANTKLAVITTPGWVANAATTATDANTSGAIVARDGAGNFSAGTITAQVVGNVTGSASANVLKAGDTMTGSLVLDNQMMLQLNELGVGASNFVGLRAPQTVTGSYTLSLPPAVGTDGQVLAVHPTGVLYWTDVGADAGYFVNGGNTVTGTAYLGTLNNNGLYIETNNVPRIQIANTGALTLTPLASVAAGLVHADTAGLLSKSLLQNADIPDGGIANSKLATLSTAGLVQNSATTATNANTPGAIVARDGSGNFTAGTITANIIGNVTGNASGNVLKSGDTMTGSLTLSGGSSDLTVGGATSLQATQTHGLLTVNNGVYFVNGEPCLPEHVVQVTKGTISGPNQFNSIKAAVDSITGNTSTTPYVVEVGPGLFVEDTIMLKPYVAVVGSGGYTTLIVVDAPSKNVIVGVPDAILKNVWIQGATGSGSAGIVYHGGTGGFEIQGCVFASNDILLSIDDATGPYSFIDVNSIVILPVLSCTTGIKVRGSINPVTVQVHEVSWPAVSNPILGSLIDVSGPTVSFSAMGFEVGSIGSSSLAGTACTIANGSKVEIQSSCFHGFTTAINLPLSIAGPDITMVAVSCLDNTNDIVVANALASGTINGVFDRSKVSIVSGADLAVFFTDPVNAGTATAGPMFLGSNFSQLTNVSNQIDKGANLGVMSGGTVTASGTTFSVAAGSGYLMVGTPPNDYLAYITWNAQSGIALLPNVNYVYIDNTGTAHTSISAPNPLSTILLGIVDTDAAGNFVFLQQMPQTMNHTGTALNHSWTQALGPLYVSGSTVTENDGTAVPPGLDVTAGNYYYGANAYLPSGGVGISWDAFYKSGASGDYVSTAQSTVDYTHYNHYDPLGPMWSLELIPGGSYARHGFYVVNDGVYEKYLLVYGQTVYATLDEAKAGTMPLPPSTWTGNITPIASIIVPGAAVPPPYISAILDERPRVGVQSSSVSGSVTLHDDLGGRDLDANHLQYLLISGTRAMTGNLNMGSNNVVSAGTYNGVTVQTHASRHQPGGADPLLVATPVTIGTTNSQGAQTTLALSDHVHAHGAQTDPTLHAVASALANGFMSASDYTLLHSFNPSLYVLKAGDTMTGPLLFTLGAGNALAVNGSNFVVSATGNVTIGGATTLSALSTGVVHSTAGLLSSSLIVNGDIATGTIGNDKLVTLSTAGLVANSATTATASNSSNAIVARDSSGNFAASQGTFSDLLVTGPTITLNTGGAPAANVGIVVHDSGLPTGSILTTLARDGWILQPPGVTGKVTFLPGAAALTINQSSHNPVTIGTANGLSISGTQQLSLALSGSGTTGALSSADWSTFNSKQNGSATLTALSAYNTNGLMTQTASNTFTGRTIVGASANQVIVSNGNGVEGNPTLSLPQDINSGATPTFAGLSLIAAPQATLRLYEDSGNGTEYVGLQAPSSIGAGASYTLTFPNAVGAQNQVLVATDNVGTLGWITGLPGYVLIGGNSVASTMVVGTDTNYGLSLETNNTQRLQLGNDGSLTVVNNPNFTTTGIVHSVSGLLSSSLIVNADISATANITDSKLATISTAGKVANSATTASTGNPAVLADTIVLRDGSGGFRAGTITAALIGNVTGNVTGSSTSFTGSLSGDVTGTQSSTTVSTVGGVTAANVALGANAANAATSVNTANTIVKRDASGNFSAGTITAALSGHASLDLPLTGGTLTGSLTMNNQPIIMSNGSNAVTLQVPGVGLSDYALTLPGTAGTNGYVLTTNGSGILSWQPTGAAAGAFVNGGNTFVGDATLGTLNSGVLTLVTGGASNERLSISATGTISIPAFTTQGVLHNNTSGVLSSSLVVDSDLQGPIGNDKLATLTASGLVSNSATSATSNNSANTIVLRDASGGFNAGYMLVENQGQIRLQELTSSGTGTVVIRAPAALSSGTYTLTLPLANGAPNEALVTDGSGNLSWAAFAPTGNYFAQNGNDFGGTAILGTTGSNGLNLVTGGVGNTRLSLSSTGVITVPGFSTDGVVHSTLGVLSSSKIVNADVSDTAAIADTKLASISTAGKVLNSATTATSSNVASAIVARDASGEFNAGTIILENQGQLRLRENAGNGTEYVGLQAPSSIGAGASYTLTFPNAVGTQNQVLVATDNVGTLGWITGLPGYVLIGGNSVATTMVVGTDTNYGLSLETNNIQRLQLGNDGSLTVSNNPSFVTDGVVHSTSGLLSSSKVVNADVSDTANIADMKLATISTAGKVANSATTASTGNPAVLADTIVLRDGSGGFRANTITASFVGNLTGVVTGAASSNVLKAGDTMTGNLVLSNGVQTRYIQQNAGTNYVGVVAPATVGSSYTLTLPTTAGINGYALVTNGSGNLSWASFAPMDNYFVNKGNSFGGTATLGTDDAQDLIFETNDTGRMIIDSAGKFALGQTTVDPNFGVLINTDTMLVGGGGGTNTYLGIQKSPNLWGLMVDIASGVNTFSIRNATSGLLGTARMTIDNTGATNMTTFTTGMTISTLTSAGVVHNNASGLLSSSTVTNAELATASSTNTANYVVVRDGSGNFAAGTVTATGINNTAGSALTMGTTDANSVNLKSNGTNRLTIDSSGNTTYSSNYKMMAYRSSNQTVAAGATSTIVFNTELFDPGADYDVATGTYTAPASGYYMVAVNVSAYAASTIGARTLSLYRNGFAVTGYAVQQGAASTTSTRPFLLASNWLISLTVGDLVTIRYTNASGGIDTLPANYSSLQIHFMST